jgi:hypothetical protein
MSDSSSPLSQSEIVRLALKVAGSEQQYLAHVAEQLSRPTMIQVAAETTNASAQSAQNGTASNQAANSTLRRSLLGARSLAQSTPAPVANTTSNSSSTVLNTNWFLANGYMLADLKAYVAAYDRAAAHPNRAKDLQINGFSYFRYLCCAHASTLSCASGSSM